MLGSGAHLGPYEIVSALGAGGMGEVYRATDTNLGRDVAIKILPDAFAQDPERVARFEREARTLASLNHPHIAQIYGLEKSQGMYALVMELVEGEDLSQRIARGAIPIDEALPIARQIAEALEAAHEQGVIHRDLKPANIKVRQDGTVKVLDFGLAKLAEPSAVASTGPSPLSLSPTITSPALMTGVGVLLGTAAYMAPEQAKGRPADKRSDIWAFGCVLYEMLTGRRAFDGEDVADTLACVLRGQPDWTALAAGIPTAVARLLHRSLEKDRRRRLSDIADARLDIDEALNAPSSGPPSSTDARVDRSPGWKRALPWVAGVAGFATAGILLALWAPWRAAPPRPPRQLTIELGADVSLDTFGGSAAILSPDGAMLAFVAQKDRPPTQLYVRRLDQLQAAPLPGTENAHNAFFSPDGQWIAFFSGGKLKKISVTGGAAVTICDAPNDRGGVWADDGTIVFVGNPQTGVSRVSSGGGTPVSITTLADGETTQRFPQLLPGGKGVLYTGHSATIGFDEANIVVQPLPSGARKIIQRGGYYARYLPSGHLVYIHEGTLFVAPFDLNRLDVVGSPSPVLEHVASDPIGSSVISGTAQFAASTEGTFVYSTGQARSKNVPIEWMDHAGKVTPLRSTPANWGSLAFAPDGRRIAMQVFEGARSDVWVYEWARDTLTRLTFGASGTNPIWTPDSRRIVFRSVGANGVATGLAWRSVDGSGDVQSLTESRLAQIPGSWNANGTVLVFQQQNPDTNWDLMVMPLEGDEAAGWKRGTPTVFLGTTANEYSPMFSPDGRWVAYVSNESGRSEVYVRPFPGPGGKRQVSIEGGGSPKWSRTRRELFFSTPDGQIMVVPYRADNGSLQTERPQLWSPRRFALSTDWSGGFDVHPDGDRFALSSIPESQTAVKQDTVTIIFNFFDELRRIAPAK